MTEQLRIARALKAQGISTIPVSHLKIPLLPWKRLQTELPSDADLDRWFADGKSMIGLVSGSVMCIDFDEKYAVGILARFVKRAEEVGLDYLLGDLLRQRTKNNGFHLVFRCDGQRIGNEKLASRPPTEAELAANDQVTEFVMIETRGDGGYFVIAPSAGYVLEQGDWTAIPLISTDDRDALINLARTFNEIAPREIDVPNVATKAPSGFDISPGDDYDQRADLPSLLKRHGWKPARNDNRFWTRPGKDSGISASWDQVPGRFFVFSTSTKFEAQRVYKPWHVYAILECGGDFSAAARELQRQGFGRRALRTASPAVADPTPTPEGKDPLQAAPTTETEVDRMRRLWRARTFDPSKEPPPMRTTFELGGVTISTPGNLTAITAQAKTGKSSLVCAMIAAAMIEDYGEADTLTARGFNRDGKALIFVDTEQSPDDFWHQVARAKKRARLEELPTWIHAANVADLPASTSRRLLSVVLADFAQAHNGIHSVIIDGIADLVADVNDSEECNQLVAELHSLAIRYDCSIICVIHKNPGTDKVRGHLGSQIERKAETNLSLDKQDEVTVIWSAKQRRAPILKKNGPRFRWSDDMKMHITVDPTKATSDENMELLRLANAIMIPNIQITWTKLVSSIVAYKISKGDQCSQKTAERLIKDLKEAKIIEDCNGSGYRLI